MSQIGKKIIEIPDNVTADLSSNNKFTAKGPLGELSYTIMDGILLSIKAFITPIKQLPFDPHPDKNNVSIILC